MVSALGSEASGPGSSPGRGYCVAFLGRTLNSQSASLHPGVTRRWTSMPSRGGGSRNTPGRFVLLKPG